MIKELICISCPRGCHLKVDADNKTVEGNSCPRGEVYGLNEVTNPVRIVTSTVRVNGGELPVIPVKTNGAIPKHLNFECMDIIGQTVIEAPVKMGDVIIENLLGTGIDVVASRDIKCS